MNIKNFILKHFDFKVYGVVILAIIILLLTIPCSLYLPQNYGYENGLIENIQMAVLLITFIMCLKVINNRKFFVFIALIITILALREINCGRTIFFPVPNKENAFYKWNEIKYGYLAHPIFGLYMLSVAFYFIRNKLFIPLWNYISKYTIPIYNVLFIIIGIMLSLYADKQNHNLVLEEMAELFMYISLAGIIYIYGFKKQEIEF